MIVRRANVADVSDVARVVAAVAPEGFLGAQPPVDIDERAERLQALLDAALEHAGNTGAHKISLEVWTDNARAIALYAGAGFEVEGLRRDHYRRQDGRLRSTLLMGRRVPAGEHPG